MYLAMPGCLFGRASPLHPSHLDAEHSNINTLPESHDQSIRTHAAQGLHGGHSEAARNTRGILGSDIEHGVTLARHLPRIQSCFGLGTLLEAVSPVS